MLKILTLVGTIFFIVGCGGSETVVEDTTNIDTNITTEEPTVCEAQLITNTTYIDRVVEVDEKPTMCYLENLDSKFIGRIVYEDGTPYKNGPVKAVGDTWISQSMTNDNGEYSIEVKGDSRFFFSVYSPFGDYKYYDFSTPLVVPALDTSKGYECEYGIDILTCYENGVLRG